MFKTILSLAVLGFASALFALTPQEIYKNFSDGSYNEYIAAFDANPNVIKTREKSYLMAISRVLSAWAVKSVKTASESNALAESVCANLAITAPDQILYVKAYSVWPYQPIIRAAGVITDFSEVYKVVRDAKYPLLDNARAYAYKYHTGATAAEKALVYSLFMSAKNYYMAFLSANSDPEKLSALESYVKGKTSEPKRALEMITAILDMNTDSTVTPERIKAVLQAANRKYARLLVGDKTSWEPVLSLIRTALEAY